MRVYLKSRDEIQKMRRAGRVVHEALDRIVRACKAGVTTAELDAIAQEILDRTGAVGLFKNYPHHDMRDKKPFPAYTCISVNQEVVHGIPGDRVVKEGDIVSVDFGARLDGWCADSATTIMVGKVAPRVRKLCQTTEHVLQIAIGNIKPGVMWSHVAGMMETYARGAGVSVVEDFVGHGIGKQMHEPPQVPNFVSPALRRSDVMLQEGMVLAVEPMCCLGDHAVRVAEDGWTVVTADDQPAAHYEHTLAVTDRGCEILTDGK